MALADSLLSQGRFDEARRWLSRVTGHATAGTLPAATAMQSIIDLTQGGLASAQIRLESLAPIGGEFLPELIRALVLYEGGSLDEAQRLLKRNLPDCPDDGPPDALIISHILLARIAWSQGDRPSWRHHLTTLEHAGRVRACQRIRCSVWIERTRISTLEGRLVAAAHALAHVDRLGNWPRADTFYFANDVDTPTVARVRLYLAQERFAEVARLLPPMIEQARQYGRLRRLLKLRLLYAIALDGTGQIEVAITQLTGALRFASEEGWRSTFIEEGACVGSLLQRWVQTLRSRVSDPDIAADFLSSLFKGFAAGVDTPEASRNQALTERERQIIGMVAQGHSISTIVDQLGLSAHTVKTHLRNLYRKLGAHGQAEAAAIARAQGLLDSLDRTPSHQHAGRLAAHYRLGSPSHPQFAVDVFDVRLDRVGRDVQPLADFPV